MLIHSTGQVFRVHRLHTVSENEPHLFCLGEAGTDIMAANPSTKHKRGLWHEVHCPAHCWSYRGGTASWTFSRLEKDDRGLSFDAFLTLTGCASTSKPCNCAHPRFLYFRGEDYNAFLTEGLWRFDVIMVIKILCKFYSENPCEDLAVSTMHTHTFWPGRLTFSQANL